MSGQEKMSGKAATDGQDFDNGARGLEITVHVKTPKEKKTFMVAENASIKEFKTLISKEFNNTPIERLCLIFAGKILKDNDNLTTNNVKDGMTVHLVIKSGNSSSPNDSNPQSSNQTPSDQSSTQSQSASSQNGAEPFMPFGLNFAQQMMNNPELVRQIFHSPIAQNLLSNPEILRNILQSNPQMRQLMERNPEFNHMLNNPSIMRQLIEFSRNPGMQQELRRNLDRAMYNLESIPGGQNALQRMFTDIQEPMLNAAQEEFGSNPFLALSSGSQSATSTSQNATGENSAPLPNPWANQHGSADGNSLRNTTAAGIQPVLQQLMTNGQSMQSLMNLTSNPDLFGNLVLSSPLLEGNPALQEQMRNALPTLMEQIQNPALMSAITNPEAVSAMTQIQEGLQRLQRAAPEFYSSMNIMPNFRAAAGVTPSSLTGSTSSSASQDTGSTGSSPNSGHGSFQEMMNQIAARMSEQGIGNNVPPEERFRPQLQALQSMGFVDNQANIQALIATSGDVNAAIDRLLNQPRHGEA